MNGIDLSEHDVRRHPGLDWRTFMAGFDYVIVRVANENGIGDAYASMLVEAARTCSKPWGIYAWPVTGSVANGAFAAGLVQQYQPGVLGLAADAEHSPRGFASAAEVEAFCRGAQDAGALAMYYCGINELYRTPFLDSLPWWMSDYDVNDGQYHDPNNQAPRPPTDRAWVIHQFTSLGWPGGGPLDVNYAPSLDFAGAPAPDTLKDDAMRLFHDPATDLWWLATSDEMIVCPPEHVWNLAAAGVPQGVLPTSTVEWLGVELPPSKPEDPVSDADALERTNALLSSGAASITGGQVTGT